MSRHITGSNEIAFGLPLYFHDQVSVMRRQRITAYILSFCDILSLRNLTYTYISLSTWCPVAAFVSVSQCTQHTRRTAAASLSPLFLLYYQRMHQLGTHCVFYGPPRTGRWWMGGGWNGPRVWRVWGSEGDGWATKCLMCFAFRL